MQTDARIYTEGDFVRPVRVGLGASDGSSTAVSSEGLTEGQEVVVGEVAKAAQSNDRNPFMPPVRRR